MSKINVNTWEPEGSSTDAVMMASGDTVTVPSGATLDVNGIIDITGATATGFPSAGFSDVNATTATGSTTYTVPTDITKLLVFITGGGGGGGGATNAAQPGSGGGSATTVIARVTVVAADTITIAIGAAGAGGGDGADGVDGGDSTFTHASGSGSGSMSTITAPGGRKGTYMTTMPVVPVAGTVGANNEGISILGGFGGGHQKNGGVSFWGPGGRGAEYLMLVATVGYAYGGGGGGGSPETSWLTGAAGADGICFIMEFK